MQVDLPQELRRPGFVLRCIFVFKMLKMRNTCSILGGLAQLSRLQLDLFGQWFLRRSSFVVHLGGSFALRAAVMMAALILTTDVTPKRQDEAYNNQAQFIEPKIFAHIT